MMTFQVRMLAFGEPGEVRKVDLDIDELPDLSNDEELGGLLEDIFRLGQNDFQPKPLPSVSVGDVIEVEDRFFVVRSAGHEELTAGMVEKYTQMPADDRRMRCLVSGALFALTIMVIINA